ncbi:tyrosine-type recombinase/integrase [Vibrio parahaemolyticus]|uniref:tyrosine-type recombinase/integrase n=2 Tax=Vibrio parahaemolyticus TaxID=670 RepID=UPI00128EC437|nr:tyrosine-type recombinase/integrase [Vibrio parahaemolyticus]EJH0831003.1 tyrosine-type recombinase/integrase [Vibrio parahaemolyticus]EKH2699906.1 tyrosine-type recombinase/integrase [Vibrio parahaemolyticus]ELA7011625.1 tyrosine-type recombinase/integrase [Vibrio parahaemolyticus]ELJ8789534.1 tyrosine-type recombinase/integrase [Vibrio parahaemolyticus]ELJ8831611.1 tyrosine-type recombinase/integrase [Vibrio parahaemolyticus]
MSEVVASLSMKLNFRVRVEVIRKLECYEPSTVEFVDSHVCSAAAKSRDYYRHPAQDVAHDVFYHYPMIVDPDGSLWAEANRYLLSRLNGFVPVKRRTLESIAGDLAHFRRWLLEEEIDFLTDTARPRARPTYRYCAYLHDEIRFGKLKARTAKRRISSVQNFYRWLVVDGVKFEYPLWLENDAALMFKDARGFQKSKSVKSTDLTRSFRVVKSNDDYSEHIDDGGKLRPLPKDEQVALIHALKAIGNTEMTLAFFLALATGARLQTVFTLRRQNFLDEPYKGAVSHRIKVGDGTPVSTKYGKQMVLLVPLFLYRRVQIYMNSERCHQRMKLSKHVYPENSDQYLFLTRTGQPYYMAENDPFTFLYRNPPRGNAVTQFIRQQLKPELYRLGFEFEFRFHDLRATFGMNLLESFVNQMSKAETHLVVKADMTKALMLVRSRMGHTSIRTTEAYLNYREKYRVALDLQSEYEAYLESMLNEVNTDDME